MLPLQVNFKYSVYGSWQVQQCTTASTERVWNWVLCIGSGVACNAYIVIITDSGYVAHWSLHLTYRSHLSQCIGLRAWLACCLLVSEWVGGRQVAKHWKSCCYTCSVNVDGETSGWFSLLEPVCSIAGSVWCEFYNYSIKVIFLVFITQHYLTQNRHGSAYCDIPESCVRKGL